MFQSLKKTFPITTKLHHYPALTALICIIIGISIHPYLVPITVSQLVLVGTTILAFSFHRKTTLTFIIVGVMSISFYKKNYDSQINSIPVSKEIPWTLTFHSSPRYSTDSGAVQSVQAVHNSAKYIFEIVSVTPIIPGEIRTVLGTASKIPITEEPWQVSQSENAEYNGIHGVLLIQKQLNSNLGNSVLSQNSKNIMANFKSYPNPTQGLLRALICADRSELQYGIKELFRRTGVSHLLALSGLHTATLIILLTTLLRPLMLHKKLLTALLITLPWILLLFTGLSSSIVRSLIMSSLIIATFIAKRPTTSINSLGAAGVIILLFSPGQLYSPGFQLSFGAVGAILIMIHFAGTINLTNTQRKIANFILVPTAAAIGTTPITAAFFGTTIPAGLLANLYITPLFTFYFTVAIILFIGSFYSVECKEFLISLTDSFIDLIHHSAILINQPPVELFIFHPLMIYIPISLLVIIAAIPEKRKVIVLYCILIYLTSLVVHQNTIDQFFKSEQAEIYRTQNVDYVVLHDKKVVTTGLIRWLREESHSKILVVKFADSSTIHNLYPIQSGTLYSNIYAVSPKSIRTEEIPNKTHAIGFDDTLVINHLEYLPTISIR